MHRLSKVIMLLWNATLSSNTKNRYAAQHRLFSAVAYRFGLRLYNINLGWHDDTDVLAAWRKFDPSSKSIPERKFILYSMAKSLASLEGDSAECGVYDGGSSYLMCLAAQNKRNHCHHIFDSFEGLSQPEREDIPQNKRTYRWKQNDLAFPLQRVQRNLARFDFVRYYQGWIPRRFHEVNDCKFSFVHIDVDLYQPTKDSITFFYERMVPGGILLCDDYGSTACPGAKQAFDELMLDKAEGSVIHLTTGQGFIVKRPA